MKPKFKRRKKMIDPAFQWRFVVKMTAWIWLVLLSSAALVALVYTLSRHTVSQPDPFASNATVALYNLPEISVFIAQSWLLILLAAGLITVVSVVFGVMESFRVAGPVYRMRQVLSAMADGDVSVEIIPLRPGDELGHLYEDVCDVHEYWQSSIREMQDICVAADDDPTAQLAQLKALIAAFKVQKVA
ncbi:MAG: hypothetical protein R8J84_08665 [Mariprofundales bacterium]